MDESLPFIQGARAGDAAAIDSLIALHLPGLRGFLQNRAGNLLQAKEPVSDLVQSTCREVLMDLRACEPMDEAQFKNWLYQAALHKLVDKARYWKAARRDAGREARPDADVASRSVHALSVLAADLGSPSEAAMGREELRRIEAALGRLPKEHRDVILMARFLDLPHAEIARQSGRTEGAVRALLFRAMAGLRRELGLPESES